MRGGVLGAFKGVSGMFQWGLDVYQGFSGFRIRIQGGFRGLSRKFQGISRCFKAFQRFR